MRLVQSLHKKPQQPEDLLSCRTRICEIFIPKQIGERKKPRLAKSQQQSFRGARAWQKQCWFDICFSDLQLSLVSANLSFPTSMKEIFFLRPVVKSWHGHKAKRGLHIHKKKQNKWSVNSQSSGCGVVPTGVALPGCTITATHLSPAFTNRLITCAGDDSSSHLIPTG